MSVRLRKNDRVQVISGKDKGREGKIMRRFPARDMVVVEGVNMVSRHRRALRRGSSNRRPPSTPPR